MADIEIEIKTFGYVNIPGQPLNRPRIELRTSEWSIRWPVNRNALVLTKTLIADLTIINSIKPQWSTRQRFCLDTLTSWLFEILFRLSKSHVTFCSGARTCELSDDIRNVFQSSQKLIHERTSKKQQSNCLKVLFNFMRNISPTQ